MKIAIIEASHWHVPLYLNALETDQVEVAAVSDETSTRGPAIAARFGANHHVNWRQLVAEEHRIRARQETQQLGFVGQG